MNFPKPADGLNGLDGLDGLDGKSISNVEIDANNHLICYLDDGTSIDAGEIKSIGGGLIQENKISDFPQKGKEDTLYLSRDTDEIFYWSGTEYKPIISNSSSIMARLRTAELKFDSVNNTFDLPIENVKLNVYVNGLYLTENIDYSIDRISSPNKITFDEIYEDSEICTLTYLNPVEGTEFDYATKADIDALFKEE